MKQVLAFFGAFNPPTIAHLELAEYAMQETGREGVLFVPSKSVYIREEQGKDFAFLDEERLSMLLAAAKERPWMQVTDIEIRAMQQPRTYETLCALREQGYAPTLLFGADKLTELEKEWLYVEEICREFGIVCLSRGGTDTRALLEEDLYLKGLSPWIRILDSPAELRQVSSSKVRAHLLEIAAQRAALAQMVPAEVLELLFTKTL